MFSVKQFTNFSKKFLTLLFAIVSFCLCISCIVYPNANQNESTEKIVSNTKENSDFDNKEKCTVNVSGIGTVNMKADIVSFSIRVTETEETTSLAQQRTNEKISKILEILKEFGVEENDISTSSLNFQTSYKWIDGEQIKIGEQVSQTLDISLNNIDKFAPLVDMIGSQLTGIFLNNVSFACSDYSQAIVLARTLAYQNAEEKAHTYADCAKMKLGKPITISDYNDYSYTTGRYYSNNAKFAVMEEAADTYYQTETPSGLLNVSVSTNIVFELLDF